MMTQFVLSLRNELSEIERLTRAVEEFGRGHGMPEETVHDARLALEEIVVNVIQYAWEDGRGHEITVLISLDEEGLLMRVEDDGKPFDPLSVLSPVSTGAPERRRAGGFGVRLARSVVNSMEYRRDGNRNVLVMRRKITSGRGENR